eukprot:GHVS01108328.1.p2 GENE.GHVS01108328.1~~GHVS01108328.1.p2  ORF type:complete len:103 (-),score=14.54 GHVS01108328.1:62-370(-)
MRLSSRTVQRHYSTRPAGEQLDDKNLTSPPEMSGPKSPAQHRSSQPLTPPPVFVWGWALLLQFAHIRRRPLTNRTAEVGGPKFGQKFSIQAAPTPEASSRGT